MTAFTVRTTSGILLIVSFVLHLGGVLLFTAKFYGWYIETRTYLIWERGLFMAAYAAAAPAVALLEIVLRDAGAAVLARLAATVFVMAAVLALVAEAASLSQQGSIAALVVVMVVLLFIAEAICGGALLKCGVVPAWIAWTMIAWNIGWLLVLPIVSPADIYYPILHFLPLLLVGIPLARRRSPVEEPDILNVSRKHGTT
jgi:hypothetical protein